MFIKRRLGLSLRLTPSIFGRERAAYTGNRALTVWCVKLLQFSCYHIIFVMHGFVVDARLTYARSQEVTQGREIRFLLMKHVAAYQKRTN